MVTPFQGRERLRKRGGVTLELAVSFVVIGIPLTLVLTQLGRIDRAGRQLQFAAQEAVVSAGVSGNGERDFRLVPVELRVHLSAVPEWKRLEGVADYGVTLKRRYWIAAGSGDGEDW